MRTLDVEITGPCDDPILAPTGTATRDQATTCLTVLGGRIEAVATEPEPGLGAALIKPEGGSVLLRSAVEDGPQGADYPEAALRPSDHRAPRARWRGCRPVPKCAMRPR